MAKREANLGDMFDLLSSTMSFMDEPYEARKVDRTDVEGLTVSTVFASDTGKYETAIIDTVKTTPVEDYSTREQAVEGHKKWCEKAKTITHVDEIDYKDFLDMPKRIKLKRRRQRR